MVGEYALHVSCAWRLVGPDGILVASGDLFTPADADADPDTFQWDVIGANWCDVRLRAFIEATAESPLAVVSIPADGMGGVRIEWRGMPSRSSRIARMRSMSRRSSGGCSSPECRLRTSWWGVRAWTSCPRPNAEAGLADRAHPRRSRQPTATFSCA